MQKMIQNPILRGFYPDPSICRVGEDFYMATSSFSYFPGVPVFHSRDLCEWEQIGHVLDRPEQLPLNGKQISGGIFAPTIRYHEGVFYMITTNVDHGGNFIVTASDPAGPWSKVHWIANAPGIDPSLFWDDDGSAYMLGTAGMMDGGMPIWMCEIDLQEMKLVGERKPIWGGALIGAAAPEAPHLYKKDGWYYLMIAEGGTEHFHAVTIARSRDIWGPYEGNPGNPIMTHRHLGENYPICNTGHADLVELADGSWYIVMLASRIYGGYHKNLGRETFLAPVEWELEWPVISPGTGRIEWSYPAPEPLCTRNEVKPADVENLASCRSFRDDFDGESLPMWWNFLGTPLPQEIPGYTRNGGAVEDSAGEEPIFSMRDSHLYICTAEQGMVPREDSGKKMEHFFGTDKPVVKRMPFLGRRQQDMSFEARTKLDFTPTYIQAAQENSLLENGRMPQDNGLLEDSGEAAGLMIVQNAFHGLRLEVTAAKGVLLARVVKSTSWMEGNRFEGNAVNFWKEEILGSVELSDAGSYELIIRADGQKHQFLVVDGDRKLVVCEDVDGGFLGSETAGGFVGAYVGLFASGNGLETGRQAGFDWFTYQGKESMN